MVDNEPRSPMSSPVAQTRLSSFLWGTHGPGGHVCQLYDSEAELVDTLTGYVGGALWNGESVIVVASHAHTDAMEARLRESGLDLGFLRSHERYVPASAESTLAHITVDGMPDEAKFGDAVDDLLERAGGPRRRVRIFGEMVALLWQRRQFEAALRHERLWNAYLEGRALPLLCAYPRRDFKSGSRKHVMAIEREHAVLFS
jgi:hypothetical protein